MSEENRNEHYCEPGEIIKNTRANRQVVGIRDNSFKRIMLLWYGMSLFIYLLCTAMGIALAYFVTKLIIELKLF